MFIKGITHRFSYHLKPEDDIRIYFKYLPDEDKIYFGHAGKHLKTFTRRK
ncbi:MAG: hypothetical protein KAX49_10755 [Halanaerobiales bacterium]|nr:hypothetical protein [Halanaerobiales bacterium]